jgi:hypothetical protein
MLLANTVHIYESNVGAELILLLLFLLLLILLLLLLFSDRLDAVPEFGSATTAATTEVRAPSRFYNRRT